MAFRGRRYSGSLTPSSSSSSLTDSSRSLSSTQYAEIARAKVLLERRTAVYEQLTNACRDAGDAVDDELQKAMFTYCTEVMEAAGNAGHEFFHAMGKYFRLVLDQEDIEQEPDSDPPRSVTRALRKARRNSARRAVQAARNSGNDVLIDRTMYLIDRMESKIEPSASQWNEEIPSASPTDIAHLILRRNALMEQLSQILQDKEPEWPVGEDFPAEYGLWKGLFGYMLRTFQICSEAGDEASGVAREYIGLLFEFMIAVIEEDRPRLSVRELHDERRRLERRLKRACRRQGVEEGYEAARVIVQEYGRLYDKVEAGADTDDDDSGSSVAAGPSDWQRRRDHWSGARRRCRPMNAKYDNKGHAHGQSAYLPMQASSALPPSYPSSHRAAYDGRGSTGRWPGPAVPSYIPSYTEPRYGFDRGTRLGFHEYRAATGRRSGLGDTRRDLSPANLPYGSSYPGPRCGLVNEENYYEPQRRMSGRRRRPRHSREAGLEAAPNRPSHAQRRHSPIPPLLNQVHHSPPPSEPRNPISPTHRPSSPESRLHNPSASEKSPLADPSTHHRHPDTSPPPPPTAAVTTSVSSGRSTSGNDGIPANESSHATAPTNEDPELSGNSDGDFRERRTGMSGVRGARGGEDRDEVRERSYHRWARGDGDGRGDDGKGDGKGDGRTRNRNNTHHHREDASARTSFSPSSRSPSSRPPSRSPPSLGAPSDTLAF